MIEKLFDAENKGEWWLAKRFAKGWYGVCLGKYILFTREPREIDLKHEQGHQKQYQMLGGFLYYLIIGIPSFFGNLIQRIFKYDYYKQPWEAWADRLGGVERHS